MTLHVTPHPDVVFTDLGTEGVIMHSVSGEAFQLNASGTLLWRSCPADMPELAQVLVRQWRIPQERAEADVSAWLERVRSRGLVVVEDGAEGLPR